MPDGAASADSQALSAYAARLFAYMRTLCRSFELATMATKFKDASGTMFKRHDTTVALMALN